MMNYISLIQEVAKRTDNEQIVDNFSIQLRTENYDRVNYLAEYVHKQGGWDVLFDVVFGKSLSTTNEGTEGLYEYYVDNHTGYIQNKVEHGFNRKAMFQKIMAGEPKWATELVAESELDHWDHTDPEYWSEEDKEYVKYLEKVTGRYDD